MNNQPSPGHFKKVLLIDDDEVDLFISTKILKSASFANEIITKSSADEGLKFLKKLSNTPLELPSIIFLDLRMPSMDGYDFLNEFEKLPDCIKTSCEIILLTNSVDLPLAFATDAKKNLLVKKILLKPLTAEALDEVLVQYK